MKKKINYTSTYGVNEVARILSSDKDSIKRISYILKEYCSKEANPPKNSSRTYSIEDILVIHYALFYWENDPDIENIKIGLNREEHLEEPFTDIISKFLPIFREVNDHDMGTNIPMLGEMTGWQTFFELANFYKMAGDYLVDSALKNHAERELLYPIVFNYRHSLELFLKSINPKYKETHDLDKLYQSFKNIIKTKFEELPPGWFEEVILILHEFDSKGINFRYGEKIPYIEFVVELKVFKERMNWISAAFDRIRIAGIDTK